jgi:lipopolysaccharide transport system permease protein
MSQINEQPDMGTQLPSVVYSPQSRVRTPGLLVRSMFHDFKRSKELAWRLFVRDVSAQYRQSILGILWAFAPAIMSSAIFILLQSRGILNVGETDIPYPVYVLTGTMLWQLFTESLNAPLKSATMSKSMLAKINFPHEALIISAIYGVLFNLLIKVVVLVIVFIYFGVNIYWSVFLVPLTLLMLMLFGISVGLLLTPIGMLYTDITAALPVVTQLWFFLTPVIYPPPSDYPLSILMILNPVSPLLIGARELLTVGYISDIGMYLIACGVTSLTLLVAWVLYHVAQPIIIERISA